MAKSKLIEANQKIAKGVTEGFQKIEDAVVVGYKKIEQGVVDGYTKIEDKFVDQYLTREGETVEEAKARLKNKPEAEKIAPRLGVQFLLGWFTWCRRYGHRHRPDRARCRRGR